MMKGLYCVLAIYFIFMRNLINIVVGCHWRRVDVESRRNTTSEVM